MNNIPQVVSLATGLKIDEQTLWRAFQRIRTLVRAVNVRNERPP
jgi:hypothetical protein